jgi:hypothetical protein
MRSAPGPRRLGQRVFPQVKGTASFSEGTTSIEDAASVFSRSAGRLYDDIQRYCKGLELQTRRLHQGRWQLRPVICQGTDRHQPQGRVAGYQSANEELHSKPPAFRLSCQATRPPKARLWVSIHQTHQAQSSWSSSLSPPFQYWQRVLATKLPSPSRENGTAWMYYCPLTRLLLKQSQAANELVRLRPVWNLTVL